MSGDTQMAISSAYSLESVRSVNQDRMSTKSTIIAVLALAVSACAVLQEITFYTDYDQQGDGIVFRSNWNNFTDVQVIISTAKSFCVVG